MTLRSSSIPHPLSADAAHWLIVGAGALGLLFASALAPRCRVTLLGRRTAAPFIQWRTVDGEDRRITVQRRRLHDWAADRSAADIPALVVLATKSHDTKVALKALASRLAPTTPLLLLQNGFQVQPDISECWSGPVLCASTTQAAYRPTSSTDPLAPEVVHAAAGETWIGDLSNQHVGLAALVAERLTEAGVRCRSCLDIRQRLWHKLAINAVINPLTACHGVTNGTLAQPEFRPRVTALMTEIEQIMHAENVPPPAAGWQALVDGVIESTAVNHSSMLQDVLAGRPTERDAILGPLIDARTRHRLDTPELDALYRATPG